MQPFSINNAQEYVGAVSNKWTPIRVPYLRLQKSGDKRRLYFCSYRCAVQTLLINNRQECSCDVFARKDNRSKTFSLSQIEQHNEWMDPRVVILDKRQIDFCSYRYKHYNKLYTVNLLIYINVMINLHKWILLRHLCSQKSENNIREYAWIVSHGIINGSWSIVLVCERDKLIFTRIVTLYKHCQFINIR